MHNRVFFKVDGSDSTKSIIALHYTSKVLAYSLYYQRKVFAYYASKVLARFSVLHKQSIRIWLCIIQGKYSILHLISDKGHLLLTFMTIENKDKVTKMSHRIIDLVFAR